MEFLNNLIDDFWTFISNSQEGSESANSIFYNFFYSIFQLILKWITEGWSFLFGEFTTFIYGILFNNYGSTVNTGKYAIGRIFSFQSNSSDVFSVDMIYFFFGCIITVFVFKFIINILLKVLGMLR